MIHYQAVNRLKPSINYAAHSDLEIHEQVKKILKTHFSEFLIKKGILDPGGNQIINPQEIKHLLKQAFDQQVNLRTNDRTAIVKNSVRFILDKLGFPLEPIVDIPTATYDIKAAAPMYGTQAHQGDDVVRMTDVTSKQYGLLLGGLGTGGIGMYPDGSFPCVNFLKQGRNLYDASQNVISGFHLYTRQGETIASRPFQGDDLTYHALYPFTWHELNDDHLPIQAAITSFSPIIPNNFKETAYPVVLYTVSLKNTTDQPVESGVMLQFKNLAGYQPRYTGIYTNDVVETRHFPGITPQDGKGSKNMMNDIAPGLWVHRSVTRQSDAQNDYLILSGKDPQHREHQGEIAIAAPRSNDYTITIKPGFNLHETDSVDRDFYAAGKIKNTAHTGDEAGVLAITTQLQPGQTRNIPLAFVYDFPNSEFGPGNVRKKQYTQFFNPEGGNGVALARTALARQNEWETQVKTFQNTVLNHPEIPTWFKGDLLNTLSLLQSNCLYGGTVEGKPYHLMAESNLADYEFSETRDVGLYEGARRLLWPELHKNLMTHFASTVPLEDLTNITFNYVEWNAASYVMSVNPKLDYFAMPPEERRYWLAEMYEKQWGIPAEKAKTMGQINYGPLKVKGAAPHDIGGMSTDPINQLNIYKFQNANEWSELSMCIPIEVLLDYQISGQNDFAFIQKNFENCKCAMDYVHDHFTGATGLPIHRGVPDQTYDTWDVKGAMTYTSYMYLIALKSMIRMAGMLGQTKDAATYQTRYDTARNAVLEKLWMPEEQRFRLSEQSDDVFADCLCMLYGKIMGFDIFPDTMIQRHLNRIFESNVKAFGEEGYGKGYVGAVNGTKKEGGLIRPGQPSEEWIGTSYALGATMLAYNMPQQGWQTLFGTYNLATNVAKVWGQWPEALTQCPGIGDGPMYSLRAITYYRALANWNVWILATLGLLNPGGAPGPKTGTVHEPRADTTAGPLPISASLTNEGVAFQIQNSFISPQTLQAYRNGLLERSA